MNAKTLRLLLALVLGCGLTIGCDDDTPTDQQQQSNTIVDVASANADFSTLVAALQKAQLVETLKGPGPFTVFAPTNAAFVASGITDLNAFSADELKTILLYHVISGAKVVAADVKSGPTDSAADLTLFLAAGGGVSLNGGSAIKGGATVATADVAADNGVIHIIDRVLLPPTVAGCATYGGLNELVGAIGAAASLPDGKTVLETLNGDGDFTVFAPVNAAFKAITAPSDPEALRDILLYHVLGSRVASNAIPLKADSLLNNSWGNGVTMLFDTSSSAKVNGVNISATDIKCTNGTVHLVDQVLLPPNVVDMASIAGLTELVKAVGAAAALTDGTTVVEALKATAPYTILAPTNAAFASITAPSDPIALRDVLLLHVIQASAPVLSSGLPSEAVGTLNAGASVTFDASGPSVSSGSVSAANIGPFDINVVNGVVHVIDKVLLP